MKYTRFLSGLLLGLIVLMIGCSKQTDNQEVVIYTSVDQVYSANILKQFEKESGISVKAVFDAEASKAVGLEQRLLAEKSSPRADVFWNSEFMRTTRLAHQGLFERYSPKIIKYSNTDYFSPDKMWHGIGLRTRVFIVNKDELTPQEYPTTLDDIFAPRFKGKVAIATPFSGSTATHFAALYSKLKKEGFSHFLERAAENQIALLAGNSVVKDAVGHGKFAIGLVDSDDALVGIEQGLPVEMVYYNQDGHGSFAVFQTVALVKNGPNPSNATKLIDYLLSERIEQQLIAMHAVQFPVLTDNPPKEMPNMWTGQANDIVDSLQPSIELIRNYLD
jgi:iron(III) transport system substrate-binding protein